MKATSYVALAISCFIAGSTSAPTPELIDLTGVVGSIANGNTAGNGNGNGNGIGNGNQAGNNNLINIGLKERGLVDSLAGALGSITKPSAGNGNSNGNGNGDGNSVGNGNQAGNGNTVNLGDVNVPSVTLPEIELPDINLSPSINMARSPV
ncbi:uncharacterized protein CC84DRAFT_1239417 [Paraphaeosphaeria sporulosa]|uniref:Uncharacterized protein n=1 Tax=Paraphaeosphaeria sporulosa TaxID=1460663 RepID=A0A177CMY2_9PLEO|nr:uncharacterized protein CC84DRAFT_1239417 [Paraphaeosphaeria sporulosa]OAG08260.1 hypothetical protein CC84DRAFT_1239417 [Paraphaeosphaeria sporulosa]